MRDLSNHLRERIERDAGLGTGLARWARFNSRHRDTHCFIRVRTTLSVVNKPMAYGVKGNDRVDVVRSVICKPVDMMAFEVWSTIPLVERRGLPAALAFSSCSIEHVCRYRGSALVSIARTSSNVRVGATGFDGATTELICIDDLKFIDLILQVVLAERICAGQDEHGMRSLPSLEIYLDFVVAIIDPFAIKSDAAFFADEKQKRSPVCCVVSYLRVVVSIPSIVVVLGGLSVILISAVSEMAIVVSWVIRVRHGYDRLFELAVLNPLLGVSAEYLFDLRPRLKNLPDIILPSHCDTTPFVRPVVAEICCDQVKNSMFGGRE